MGNGRSWTFLARNSDGQLVGMIGGYRDDNDLQNHSAQIFGVYVDKEMRGKGIAKALMSRILEEIKTEPEVIKISLEVNSEQESATKLYQSFGFTKITPSYPHQMGDGQEHQVSRMELSFVK